jgi:hypothetical protein
MKIKPMIKDFKPDAAAKATIELAYDVFHPDLSLHDKMLLVRPT